MSDTEVAPWWLREGKLTADESAKLTPEMKVERRRRQNATKKGRYRQTPQGREVTNAAERERYARPEQRARHLRNRKANHATPEGRARDRAKQARRRRATPPWVNPKDLERFAGCPEGHHTDHIWPLNGKLSSELNVPWNLQYLPDAENMAKGNRTPGQNYLDWWTPIEAQSGEAGEWTPSPMA